MKYIHEQNFLEKNISNISIYSERGDLMLEQITNELLKNFSINVRQIIANSDNEYEDVRQEAFIVVHENYDLIKENKNNFIYLLRKATLKFNKYGTRIETNARWKKYNELEESMVDKMENNLDFDEDLFLGIESIKKYCSNNEYEFLIHYFEYKAKDTAKKYGITEQSVYKKKENIINRIKKEVQNE